MGEKLAVAIIHGIGQTRAGFADGMIAGLRERVADACGPEAAKDVVMKEVLWADVVQDLEDELTKRVGLAGISAYGPLRHFLLSFAADAIAYQPRPSNRWLYEKIHGVLAETLRELALEAGPRAPLCVVAHSLGSVIASNYFYDLQVETAKPAAARSDTTKSLVPHEVKVAMGPAPSPLERGETLTHFFTLGSPLAVWSLANKDFGVPINVPSPHLAVHHPALVPTAGWFNMYDRQDVIAYPLKGLNEAHSRAVREDIEVDVGTVPVNWTPMSHTKYWTDASVLKPISKTLTETWSALNPQLVQRT